MRRYEDIARAAGRAEGMQQGMQQGMRQGMQQGRLETAASMLLDGMAPDKVAKKKRPHSSG